MVFSRVVLSLALSWPLTVSLVLAQEQIPRSVYEQVTSAFQQGKTAQAEQSLRAALEKYPRDPRALSLMGVILDAQKRYTEAEKYYHQALAILPGSASLLNNLANHYFAEGDMARARATYLKVLAIDASHSNANLQMARLSVAEKQPAAALQYLDRLTNKEQAQPAVELLRAQALELGGKHSAAEQLFAHVEKQAGSDPRVVFSIGMFFADQKRYEEAEKAFTRALEVAPEDFDILYNLGLAATRAGHLERAEEIYQVALRQRPDDVDCLYNLARVYAERGQNDQASITLFHAQRLAPERTDVLLFLAGATEKLGFYGDSAVAYDKYLKLRPNDDVARRKRGFALARTAKLDEALVDLRWYAKKHPEDPRGLYELGFAETVREQNQALKHFDQAIHLDPNLTPARYGRAVLYYQQGKALQCVADMKFVLDREPRNYQALDLLGQAYLQLNQPQEAAQVLGCAAALAPKDGKVLMHYSRVLIRLNRKEEAAKVLAAFKALGPEESRRRPYGGLFEYLSLPPAEQRAHYLANLQRTITTRPDDPGLRVRLGRALLDEGKTSEALEAFRTVRELSADPKILAECGKTLLDTEQYQPAREFLDLAVAADPTAADARLDLALAVFHSAGLEAGLAELDKTPPAQRQGDYFLLRAQILDAMKKPREAAAALDLGLRSSPTRPDLYLEAALFLIKHTQYQQAVNLLQKANSTVPDVPELMLTQAIAYELLQQPEEAQRLLTQLESRWPEWSLPYMVNGIQLEIRLKSAQAKPLLETAISLGAHDPNAYYYLASAITHVTPEDTDAAQNAIEQAVQLNPDDVYIRSLAGKISYIRRDYKAALEHLTTALRLWPDMVEAHQTLSATYRALGENEKSIAELKEIVRIKQENPSADQTPPFPAGSLLFTVRPPTRPTS
jgi:superkiller protein 3